VTEEYLRQLGARPLAAALTDLERLLAAAAAGPQPGGSSSSSSSPGEGAASLAAGVALQPESGAALARLGQILSDIQLADSVMKLDLGPDMGKTLDGLKGVTLFV
jgi:hypothetical protein